LKIHALKRFPNGSCKCEGCLLCATTCPSQAIEVIVERDKKEPTEFIIDLKRCIFCEMCIEVCPNNAIDMVTVDTLSTCNPNDLVLNKKTLLSLGG